MALRSIGCRSGASVPSEPGALVPVVLVEGAAAGGHGFGTCDHAGVIKVIRTATGSSFAMDVSSTLGNFRRGEKFPALQEVMLYSHAPSPLAGEFPMTFEKVRLPRSCPSGRRSTNLDAGSKAEPHA
jgi:hypothetical protein